MRRILILTAPIAIMIHAANCSALMHGPCGSVFGFPSKLSDQLILHNRSDAPVHVMGIGTAQLHRSVLRYMSPLRNILPGHGFASDYEDPDRPIDFSVSANNVSFVVQPGRSVVIMTSPWGELNVNTRYFESFAFARRTTTKTVPATDLFLQDECKEGRGAVRCEFDLEWIFEKTD